MKKQYVAPRITTVSGRQVVETLGYASATIYNDSPIGD